MNPSSQPDPVDWHALVDQHAADAAADVRDLAKSSGGLAERGPASLITMFAGLDGVLACGLVLCGSDATRPLIEGFHPFLPRVVAALDATRMRAARAAHFIANFALVAECAGTPRLPAFDSGLLKPLVPGREEFFDAQRRSMALTCLALGDTATALRFLDVRPAAYDEPRVAFEFNLHELIRYLAAALDQRWPADWVEPAWLEYLNLFPLHLAADAAEWPDLFMFARVLAALRGDRIADIADDLHARVQRLAQEAE
jgi:hypothetical protein